MPTDSLQPGLIASSSHLEYLTGTTLVSATRTEIEIEGLPAVWVCDLEVELNHSSLEVNPQGEGRRCDV
jgi:hypothetical protein